VPQPDVDALVEDARAGRARAVGRLLSLVEEESPALRRAITLIAPHTGRAHVIGMTGAPGVGKSTSTSAVVTELRRRGRRVAVLAIDPSSPFSGGALLGDRVRMGDHATDPDVFIRSMAARGHLGGLSWATPQAVRVLDVAGFDVVIVETVGVGQSEVDVAGAADTTVVLLAPGMGDGIQAAKAGILEIGDVYVVNKSDRDGAAQVRRDLRSMLALSHGSHAPQGSQGAPGSESAQRSWRPPVLGTTATSGEGVAGVVAALEAHLAWSRASGALDRRRRGRARDEIESIALTTLRRRWAGVADRSRLEELAGRVVARDLDPYAAADVLLGE
jgi:LAO/AO transport system kinase